MPHAESRLCLLCRRPWEHYLETGVQLAWIMLGLAAWVWLVKRLATAAIC